MKNWSRHIDWQPNLIAYPSTASEIQALVLSALDKKESIRVIGTGHSFTPLCTTKNTLISLDKFQGIISIDQERKLATVKAGTKLSVLGDLLYEHGLAMENLGDIDAQSIAGTISTGTHGTGAKFGTISTQVVRLKFVNGKGELIECSTEKNKNLFKAAQVSLGLLGVITEVTLQCVPQYKLKMQNRGELLKDVLETLEERNSENRNFEFYWFPYTEKTWTKTSNIANDAPDTTSPFHKFSDYVLENYVFKLICETANAFPSKNKFVSNITASSVANFEKVFHSHKVYATTRLVRFHEMEYNIPEEAHKSVLKEVMQVVNSGKHNIHFPIENRIVLQDDIYLSPAHGRNSAYIACHTYYKKDPTHYFAELEAIFRAHGGRPHWGKMNNLTSNDVADLYPEFNRFMEHRKAQDPDNIFVNPYLKKLFGIV